MIRSLFVIIMCAVVIWLTWRASQEPKIPRKGPVQDAADYFEPIAQGVERWTNH